MSEIKPASEKQMTYIKNMVSRLSTRDNHVESELIRRIEIRENLSSKEASQVIDVLQKAVPEWIFEALDKNRKLAPLFGQRVVNFLTRIDEIKAKGLIYNSPAAIIHAIDNPHAENEGVATQQEVEAHRAEVEARRMEDENRLKSKARREANYRQRKADRKAEIDEDVNLTNRIREATKNMMKVNEQYELGDVLFGHSNETAYTAKVAGFDGIVVMKGTKATIYAPENSGLKKVLFS